MNMTPDKVLHLMSSPLRALTASELCRKAIREDENIRIFSVRRSRAEEVEIYDR